MTQFRDPFHFNALVGRSSELRELFVKVCQEQVPVLCVTGQSGVGKTALVDYFASTVSQNSDSFSRTWTQSMYRASWTSALTSMRARLDLSPKNSTISEIESKLISSCQETSTLIILDNLDDGNVETASTFIRRWKTEFSGRGLTSTLLITAKPPIADQLPKEIPFLALQGLQSDAAILDLLNDLTEQYSERSVLDLGRLVEGNPQKLLFLNWIHAADYDELKERATNLQLEDDQLAVEGIIERANLPALFLIALGVHRSFVVTDVLLASLWDNFSSRGTAAYIRAREVLIRMKVLKPIDDSTYYLHESVHVQLEKALVHRVGVSGIEVFHRYFAEYYEYALRNQVTTTSLTHFIHHSLAAKNYQHALRPVLDGVVAQALATKGAAVLVRQELERLDTDECLSRATAAQEASLYIRLGGLCNDLSDHQATLRYMERARQAIGKESAELNQYQAIERQIWYYSAVSYSNLGQSDRCLQEYFKIVNSCVSSDDELASLSLGYLAHDLKYRDLNLATYLGKLSYDWARQHNHVNVIPKNACSYAETLVVAGSIPEAIALFRDALSQASKLGNRREMGRIESNLGFAIAAQGGGSDALSYLSRGRESSASVGDRRRQSQAVLFTGVARYLSGDQAEGRRLMAQAADLLKALGDGRYFIPALCWTLQTHGHTPRTYPDAGSEAALAAVARTGFTDLLEHASAHPEFAVYHDFWWRHLSAILAAS